MIANVMHRLRARQVLRSNLALALLANLIVTLPQLVGQLLMQRAEYTLSSELLQLASGSQAVGYDQLQALLDSWLGQPAVQRIIVFCAVLYLLSIAMTLGFRVLALRLLRDEEAQLGDVFSHARSFLPNLWLTIRTALRMLLWALPGTALMLLGLYLILRGSAFGEILYNAGMVATLVLALRASLTYALAPWLLADDPALSTGKCLRESKRRMQGRRMMLFALELSIFAWLLLGNLAVMLVSGAVQLLGSVLAMALSLVLNTYLLTACGSFYLDTAPASDIADGHVDTGAAGGGQAALDDGLLLPEDEDEDSIDADDV